MKTLAPIRFGLTGFAVPLLAVAALALNFNRICQASDDPNQSSAPESAQQLTIPNGARIAFLGDSNTFAGHYVAVLDALLMKHAADRNLQVVNLGVPSETASGLSEPDHPFPRPCIHERLLKTLEEVKPDVVFVCYGMNDGIYYPSSTDRDEKFRDGIERLVKHVQERGIQVVLMTPPPFEAKAVQKFGPTDSGAYAWFAPFQDYDQVLERFSEIIRGMKSDSIEVVDLRTLLSKANDASATDSAQNLTNDGVHFLEPAHTRVAYHLYERIQGEPSLKDELDPELLQLAKVRMETLRNSWLKHCGWNRPELPDGKPVDEAIRDAEATLDQMRAIIATTNKNP